MEFILSPFLNYDFIFIPLAFSRGGVRAERKRKEGGREMCYRFKAFVLFCFVLFLSCLLSAKERDLTDLAEMRTSFQGSWSPEDT